MHVVVGIVVNDYLPLINGCVHYCMGVNLCVICLHERVASSVLCCCGEARGCGVHCVGLALPSLHGECCSSCSSISLC